MTMLSSLLEEGIRLLSVDLLNNIFLYVLLLLLGLAFYLKAKDKHASFTNYTPTLLTSLGILGTFLGIVSGLLGFDTNNIEDSIGPLLGGLKTAFLTSLMGMSASIFYKLVVSSGLLSRNREQVVAEDDVGAVEVFNVMSEQLKVLKTLEEKTAARHEDVFKSAEILRDDVASIKENISSQSDSFTQFQSELWSQLENFAELLSKSATEQVIEALNNVIADFNNKLSEQFGENFARLDSAVLKLVEWQENYKQQLVDMQHKYELGVRSIGETEVSVSKISEHTSAIPSAMEELDSILKVNAEQLGELQEHLQSFSDVRDAAVASVPEIQNQIDTAITGVQNANDLLAQGIVSSTDKIQEVISASADNYRDTVDQTRAALTESAQTTANASDEIKDQLTTAVEDLNNNLRNMLEELGTGGKEIQDSLKAAGKSLFEDTAQFSQRYNEDLVSIRDSLAVTVDEQGKQHRDSVEKVFAAIEKSISDTLVKNSDTITKSMTQFDDSMGEEMTKALEQLGSNLGAITEKFTADYAILIKQMDNILSMQPNGGRPS